MGFTLKVGDSVKYGVETIQTVDFAVDTPFDSDARTTDVTVTMTVTGKILTAAEGATEETTQLALWSMIPSSSSECYKNVEIEYLHSNQVVRNYKLPNAFVVDYNEYYEDNEGIGTFELVVRQKKNVNYAAAVAGGYDA